jgi:hypothetical protein
MNLFHQVVDDKSLHPNFRNTMQKPYESARSVISSWAEGFPDRDGKFVIEFQTTFNSSFWELYIFAVLTKFGFTVDFSFAAPDFVVVQPYQFCIEAVTAQASVGTPNEWEVRLKTFFGDMKNLQQAALVDQATVRLANAISGKYEKFSKQYSQLQHVVGKPFVLAVAPFEQPFFFMQLNRAINRVLFGYDGERNAEPGKSESQWMRTIKKPNGSDIPLAYFTNPGMENLSAILFSNTATFAKVQALTRSTDFKRVVRALRFDAATRKLVQTVHEGTDYHETLLDGLSVYYNPFAKCALPRALFGGSEVAHYSFTPNDGTMHFDVPDNALFHHLSATVVPHSMAEEMGLRGLQER